MMRGDVLGLGSFALRIDSFTHPTPQRLSTASLPINNDDDSNNYLDAWDEEQEKEDGMRTRMTLGR